MIPARPVASLYPVLLLLYLAQAVVAHEGHDEYMDPPDYGEPIDIILKLHMGMQMMTWGIILPAGMVLGLTKSRWHVPTQGLGVLLSIVGVQFAHHHGGRTFYHTAHGTLAYFLFFYLMAQVCFGIFLKLHVLEGSQWRKMALLGHNLLGKVFPLLSWLQIVLGVITSLGFCFNDPPPDDYLGQCLAHFAMGGGFIAYGLALLVMLRFGGPWLARKRISQDLMDSWMILVWGVVTTFTTHNAFGNETRWSHKDMQHVSLGIFWTFAGACGIWLGRNGKRNVVPALVMGATGLAMGSHAQSDMLATMVHQIFGYTLALFAVVRIVEITFLLKDQAALENPLAFQYLSPLLLIFAGMTFQSATQEQLRWIMQIGMDAVTYALLILTGAIIIFLWANILFTIYAHSGRNAAPSISENTMPRSWKNMFSKSMTDQSNDYNRLPAMVEVHSSMRRSETDEEDLELSDRSWQETRSPR